MINKTLIVISIILLSSCLFSSSDLFKNEESKNLYKVAMGFEREGELDSALVYYDKADKSAPNTPVILHARGLLKAKKELYDAAIEDINKSIELTTDERDREVRINNRALTFMEIGDMDRACVDWEMINNTSYIEKYCK